MARSRPPPLKDDVTDPNYVEWRDNIAAVGTGNNLSDYRLMLIYRRPKLERHAEASNYYAPNGLIYSKYRPNRPDPSINSRISNISDADLAAAGVPRNLLEFASGGDKSRLKGSFTEFFEIRFVRSRSNPAFIQCINDFSPLRRSILSDQSNSGEMIMRLPRRTASFSTFKNYLRGAAMHMAKYDTFHKYVDLEEYTAGEPHRISMRYKPKNLNGRWISFFINAEDVDSSWADARKVMRQYRVSDYRLYFGWAVEEAE